MTDRAARSRVIERISVLLLWNISSRKCTCACSLLVRDVVDVLLRILMIILELKLRFQFNESAWDVDWRVNVS